MSNIQRLKLTEIQNGKVINADDLNAELDQLITQSNALDAGVVALNAQPLVIGGTKTFSQGVKTDTVQPATSGAAVVIDRLAIAQATNPETPVTGQLWFNQSESAIRLRREDDTRYLQMIHPTYIGGPGPRYSTVSTVTLPYGLTALDDSGQHLLTVLYPDGLVLTSAANGPTGLDVGTVAANQWYYIWLCQGTSGTSAILSTSLTAPVLPTGYNVAKRMLPIALRTDGDGQFMNFRVVNWPYNPLILYANLSFDLVGNPSGNTLVVNHGTSTTFAGVDLSQYVPSIAEVALLQVAQRSNSVWLRRSGSMGAGIRLSGVAGHDISQQIPFVVGPNSALEYRIDANSTHISVIGYYVRIS